ncbi:hypothetical protein CHGG_09657 [Chaetomium globosum CBS 148.51]|uniref:DUF155 domain-containing protein n=1 Tax=Chaetomium globosum (strain ATCC 6205 / CBS 148.51 / DSM 1962 / NBRC 6347 / NRRL 1970) TaxID=306901 RepID=Q2GQU7_CHAGB|nr:uncharacterized protein CHGG_09657 [Chaetomium globosum CBS 148.51]EAQ83253.1 hypothetical protein CHGG_09657 [Chaetomium globosum CBS 148.51]
MRPLLPNLGSVARSANPAIFSSAPPRHVSSHRNFHPTPAAWIPRRRNFFTSNVLLLQDGKEPPGRFQVGKKDDEDNNTNGNNTNTNLSTHKKRKPPLKNSLHRVAIVAQKGAPAKPPLRPLPNPKVGVRGERHNQPPYCHFVESKEEEDLEFLVDPEQDQSRVTGDVVVLGTRREVEAGDRLETTLAKIAFSSGLARSTKLAVLESSLTRYLESTRHIPEQLSQGLHTPLTRGMILQKAGELLNLRSQLNHYNDLTDALPDIFWDTEEKLETYYAKIGKALDVGVRIKTLNDKMTYAQEVVGVAQGVLDISEKMSSEAHSTRLEWIIIILIAIEVAFELRRLYMERYDVFQDELLAELRALRADMRQDGKPREAGSR